MPTKEDKSAALQGQNILPHPQFKHGFLQLIHKDFFFLISAWLCIIKTCNNYYLMCLEYYYRVNSMQSKCLLHRLIRKGCELYVETAFCPARS